MKFIKILFLIITVNILFFEKGNAQPPGQGWIPLGNIASNLLPTPMDRGTYDFISEGVYNLPLFSKIAFKPFKGGADYGIIRIKKIENIDPEGKRIKGHESFGISNGFNKINGSDIKNLNLGVEDGWNIYELDGFGFLERITKLNSNVIPKEFFENIYVMYSDDLNAYKEFRTKEAYKIIEENHNLLSDLYTTPQQKGWNPIKIETLEDGSVIEHYNEGVRFIKKPNGDFASFLSPKDVRNPKTLEIEKGLDKPLDSLQYIIGAYKYTFKNGVKATSDGIYDRYELNDGTIVELNNFSNGIRNNNKEFDLKRIREYENLKFTYPLIAIRYISFINPEDAPIEFKLDSKKFGGQGSNVPYIPMAFKVNYNGTDYFFNAWKYEDDVMIEFNGYIWILDQNGVQSIGIATSDAYFPNLGMVNEITTINDGYKDCIKYVFDNGDYYIPNKDEYRLTFKDGTVLESLIVNNRNKYKVYYPDGSKYVGEMGTSLVRDNHNEQIYIKDLFKNFMTEGSPELPLKLGTIFYADGSEEEIDLLKQQAEIEKQENEAKKKKYAEYLRKYFYPKYGKATVDAAVEGNIRVGMSFKMLQDLGFDFTLRDQLKYSDWYVLFEGLSYDLKPIYRWISVDKETGKVNYVGNARAY